MKAAAPLIAKTNGTNRIVSKVKKETHQYQNGAHDNHQSELEYYRGQIEAIHRSQAVIEFELDGTIITANNNFLGALGYRLEEIQGRHHSMFVDSTFRSSPEYREFWKNLADGKFQSGEFKRIAKNGKEIWIQATYNPIFNHQGQTIKVVKYALDVTDSVLQRQQAEQREKEIVGSMRSVVEQVAQLALSAQCLASSSEELTSIGQQMTANAEETANQANVVSAASEQVSRNIQTVATSAQEMSASIREISKNSSDAAKVATSAVKVAEKTNSTVAKLGESSAEIGKVIKVITSIAQQTNLLALNATIEAARAGEAGKGFAVVANEVKELAKETAKATEDISAKIEAIQTDTKEAVAAIGQISSTVTQINDISNTIASAVEEQTATTNEIVRNVAEAARGSTEIAQNIASVAQLAKSTSSGASDSQRAAAELAKMAAELQRIAAQAQAATKAQS